MQAFQRVINCGVWLFQVSYKVTLFTFFNVFFVVVGMAFKIGILMPVYVY